MSHTFTDPDLMELDRIWPLGRKLVIPASGTIAVAGAYRGRYLRYLSERFPTARAIGYEPQRGAFEEARELLKDHNNVTIWNLGLGTGERRFEIGNTGTDGASLLCATGEVEPVTLLNAVEVLGEHCSIDLLLLNCEGYEWALVPHLLDEMMHHRIASMAIQFHPQYVSEGRARRVLEYLEEYYQKTYNDYPSWTYWKRNPASCH